MYIKQRERGPKPAGEEMFKVGVGVSQTQCMVKTFIHTQPQLCKKKKERKLNQV